MIHSKLFQIKVLTACRQPNTYNSLNLQAEFTEFAG